ncbi:hypothetical protein [Neisseria sp. oral taxon 020]|nr:hypothetical protein [Neisseria sp. oral taxon 020]
MPSIKERRPSESRFRFVEAALSDGLSCFQTASKHPEQVLQSSYTKAV